VAINVKLFHVPIFHQVVETLLLLLLMLIMLMLIVLLLLLLMWLMFLLMLLLLMFLLLLLLCEIRGNISEEYSYTGVQLRIIISLFQNLQTPPPTHTLQHSK